MSVITIYIDGWYPPVLETATICPGTLQVHPCMLCAGIPSGETPAKHSRFPKLLLSLSKNRLHITTTSLVVVQFELNVSYHDLH